MAMDIIIASNNAGKVREFKQLLSGKFDRVFSMSEADCNIEVEETGSTFFENAYLKAFTVAKLLNKPVIADDSGLICPALGDEPGIYSARYAGAHGDSAANNAKLIENLKGKDKTAYFIAVLVLAYPDGTYVSGEGRVYGSIIDEYRGNAGFGYDPIFLSDELVKTFGEATAEEKNTVSHRSRALSDLLKKL